MYKILFLKFFSEKKLFQKPFKQQQQQLKSVKYYRKLLYIEAFSKIFKHYVSNQHFFSSVSSPKNALALY